MRKSLLMPVTVVALVAGWAAAGRAANIVQNPGFEADTITLSNPTVSPPAEWTATGNVGVDMHSRIPATTMRSSGPERYRRR